MRNSGILMHITSLPGGHGIGTLGRSAFHFVDFLHRAGQSLWQTLPLTPTGYGDSPYQSCSACAGNHYLIDLDALVEEGLLTEPEVSGINWAENNTKVDFGRQYDHKLPILRLAYRRFTGSQDFDLFCETSAHWLGDYALFMALKDRFGGAAWYTWEDALKFREPSALAQARQELSDEIRFYCFVQYLFHRQWTALRGYAHEKGIRIIGDVPIYVPYDCVEVWTAPELFQLDSRLAPTAVAGCPPDAYSADGQLWGNPLYRWDVMKAQGYRWWLQRLTDAGKRYDVIRIDHFRGFEAYWSIPYGDTTAKNGQWIPGPGTALTDAIRQNLPHIEFIAEDLGFLTDGVMQLRDSFGYPGMKVLQFAFDPREPGNYLPHTYVPNTICYTGTHDNLTMQQWFDTADADAVAHAAAYMGLSESEGYVRGTIRTAMGSVSKTCIVQMQDWLGLGAESRMNCPGTMTDANWTWRAEEGFDSDALADTVRAMTGLFGRLNEVSAENRIEIGE